MISLILLKIGECFQTLILFFPSFRLSHLDVRYYTSTLHFPICGKLKLVLNDSSKKFFLLNMAIYSYFIHIYDSIIFSSYSLMFKVHLHNFLLEFIIASCLNGIEPPGILAFIPCVCVKTAVQKQFSPQGSPGVSVPWTNCVLW